MSGVVDASLIVALMVADQRQGAARARLEGWVESGEVLHAPSVLPYEVANVLARLAFGGVLQADARLAKHLAQPFGPWTVPSRTTPPMSACRSSSSPDAVPMAPTVRATSCGFAARTTPVAADDNAQLGDERTQKPLDRALLQTLAELSGGEHPYDVGCGPGHVTAFLAKRHRDVLGPDVSPRMVDVWAWLLARAPVAGRRHAGPADRGETGPAA